MSTPAGITRRTLTADVLSTIESGADLGAVITAHATVPDLVWTATGEHLIADPATDTAAPGDAAEIDLIPTDLAGWAINGSPVDVTGGRPSHAYTISVQPFRLNPTGGHTSVGNAFTYKNVLVPSGDDALDLSTLVQWTGDAGVVTLSRIDFMPSSAAVVLSAVYDGSSWPARTTVTKPFTDAGFPFTGVVMWIDPTGTAPAPSDAVIGDRFEQANP